jgi:hypothetical protein
VVESFGHVHLTGDRARSVTIADRSQRLQMAAKVIAVRDEVLENAKKNCTTAERLEASIEPGPD